jgi:uncharacterized protein (DUF3084 family)
LRGGFYGILLIVALVAVSGLIAYIGDILGRRLGRRRLSLFGLRPRHTAIVVSVIAGMLITLFTLAVAMLVNQNVKDGFLKVDYMRQRQKELSQEVEGLNRRIADLDRIRRDLGAQLDRGGAQLADTETALRETKTARDKTVAELQQKQNQLAKTKADLAKSTSALAGADRAFKRAAETQRELFSRIDSLRAIASRAEREYALERAVPILFGAGQPLDVDVMAGGQPVADARVGLNAFIARLNTEVTTAGARPLTGSKDAVLIRKPVQDPKTSQVTVARPSQVLDAVATRVQESQGQVIVRAYSVFNTHAGEPVYVDFELFRNLLVFRKGEVLAETVMDGQLSEPALMGSLVHLLRNDVGAKARAENVMPRLSPGSPNLFGSSGEQVGEMTFDDLFRVIERLRRVAGPARVTAVAADDTWTAGPLKVDIRVSPVTIASSP